VTARRKNERTRGPLTTMRLGAHGRATLDALVADDGAAEPGEGAPDGTIVDTVTRLLDAEAARRGIDVAP